MPQPKTKPDTATRRQAKLDAEARLALEALIARIPRDWDYGAEPALVFEPRLGQAQRMPRRGGKRRA
jgi:hypothetical protein